jgi:hypothetical protein
MLRLIIARAVALLICAADANAASATIEMFDEGTAVRVPIETLGGTKYFLVDTGSSHSTLDTRYAEQLGPRLETATQSTTASNVRVAVFKAPLLKAGGVALPLDRILVDDMTLARQITGTPCDGILGLDSLWRRRWADFRGAHDPRARIVRGRRAL